MSTVLREDAKIHPVSVNVASAEHLPARIVKRRTELWNLKSSTLRDVVHTFRGDCLAFALFMKRTTSVPDNPPWSTLSPYGCRNSSQVCALCMRPSRRATLRARQEEHRYNERRAIVCVDNRRNVIVLCPFVTPAACREKKKILRLRQTMKLSVELIARSTT